jgi:chorismate mutase
MSDKPTINRGFASHTTFRAKPIRDPKVEAARKARLERERNADALAAIESLQRQMREKVRQQDAWRLPDPPETT